MCLQFSLKANGGWATKEEEEGEGAVSWPHGSNFVLWGLSEEKKSLERDLPSLLPPNTVGLGKGSERRALSPPSVPF